tara:strand:+ start:572 stop:790 length:219 start_codon:yes stop_codon:yes gene_type:complete
VKLERERPAQLGVIGQRIEKLPHTHEADAAHQLPHVALRALVRDDERRGVDSAAQREQAQRHLQIGATLVHE